MAARSEFVLRPFEDLAGEADWVALREIIPAGTAQVHTTPDFGDADVTITSVLPSGWAGLHRSDGARLVALQTLAGGGDASRDVADTILRTLDLAPGTPLANPTPPGPGPRLQDILTADAFDLELRDGFDFWVDEESKESDDVKAAIEEANTTVFPTRRVGGLDHAYWCRMGDRTYVRWVRTEDEDAVLDALARVHGARKTDLGGLGKVLGAFRACGLLIPVWEVDSDLEVEELAEPFGELSALLDDAFATTGALDSAARRARQGLVSRQVTLR